MSNIANKSNSKMIVLYFTGANYYGFHADIFPHEINNEQINTFAVGKFTKLIYY